MIDVREAHLRTTLIETCRQMNARGINQGVSGNVSVRIDSGLLITPSGVPYDDMRPDQIARMDLDGGYWGSWLPSSEWRMHESIFRARPEAGAVIHAHSVYATALSCLRVDVPAFHYMIGVTGGSSLRCAQYATFGTEMLSRAMLTALEDRTACLLANHGMICFGPTLAKALWLAEEIETLCKQYCIVRQLGAPEILDSAEMHDVLTRFKAYGKQGHELSEDDAPAVEAPVWRGHGMG